jgi:hypothetical protein
MDKGNFNWKDYHHQIYQIYHGTIALTLVPFALFFLEWDSGKVKDEYQGSGFNVVSMVFLFAWVWSMWYAAKGKLLTYQISDQAELTEKLSEFKRKNVYQYLILLIAGLISAGAMWLQPSFIFVVAYLGVLVRYSFIRPSEDKIVRDMRLTKEERRKLHDGT